MSYVIVLNFFDFGSSLFLRTRLISEKRLVGLEIESVPKNKLQSEKYKAFPLEIELKLNVES